MKWTFALLMVAALGVGCTNNKKAGEQSAALTPAVTDVAPAPAPMAAAVQPVTFDAPAQAAGATGGGAKYQVKKGDTLWKIAAAHYGNGNQWQKIVSANPGLSPETLKAGQNIVIP